MILDTAFLIDLQRELVTGKSFGARGFLTSHSSAQPVICLVTWMEFAEGFEDQRRDSGAAFLARFPVVFPDTETAWIAARFARRLRQTGNSIGDHDLWIAAAAAQRQQPIVTRNTARFRRLPELAVLTY